MNPSILGVIGPEFLNQVVRFLHYSMSAQSPSLRVYALALATRASQTRSRVRNEVL